MWPPACNGNKGVSKTGIVHALLKLNIDVVRETDTINHTNIYIMCTKISAMMITA